MKFQVIQCLVALNQDGNHGLTEVIKAGPDAVSVTEIPILRALHDEGDEGCCIKAAIVVRDYENKSSDELQRLCSKYGEKTVMKVYGGARPNFPRNLDDCELPEAALGKQPKRKPVDKKAELRQELLDKGIDIPEGNLSIDDLTALIPE